MPYEIQKEGRCYKVMNTETQQVHAKCTSKKKAEAQVRLLENIVEEKPMTKGKGVRATSSWVQYYKEHTKGKKFGTRQAVNDHMKKLSIEYHKQKK